MLQPRLTGEREAALRRLAKAYDYVIDGDGPVSELLRELDTVRVERDEARSALAKAGAK